MLDYRTDGGQCAVMAASSNPGGNGANTAGGISGQNSGAPQGNGASTSGGPNTDSAPSTGAFPTGGGGAYRENASDDFVNRAAMQQRSREIAAQKARTERLKGCLVERGYTEFTLTPEQRKHLESLPQGSDERRDYLYKLGTDPQVLQQQAVAKKTN